MDATHASPRSAFIAGLDAAVPKGAHALVADGVAALAWHAGYVDTGEEIVDVVYALPGGPAMAGVVRGVSPDRLDGAVLRDAEYARIPVGQEAWRLADVPAEPHPRRAAALEALADASDVEVLGLMASLGLTSGQVHDWLSGAGIARRCALAFARAHPWLVRSAAAVPGPASAWLTDDPDADAARVLEGLVPQDRALALAGALRGFALPDDLVAIEDGGEPAAMATMVAALPAPLLPPPLAGGEDPASDAQQAFLAFFSLSKYVVALAAVSGRPVPAIMGAHRGWGPYARALAARSGMGETAADYPGEWGWILCEDAMAGVSDMVRAFCDEVLRPALALARPEAPVPAPLGRIRIGEAPGGSPMEASLRFLLGRRTLPALAELSARWHVRSDAIARTLVDVAGERAPAGPRLFEDIALPEGYRLTCLHTARSLVDEGARRPDADGVTGLGHCVGGYGETVATGRTAIVSLRRDLARGGFERVSTAEIDLSGVGRGRDAVIVQHRGLANAPPAAGADELLRAGLRMVQAGAAERLAAHRAGDPQPFDWASAMDRRGWERVRDAWSFALARPLRAACPETMLAAAGMPACPG